MEYTFTNLNDNNALKAASILNNVALSVDEKVHLHANMSWVCPFGMLIAINAIRDFRHRFIDNRFTLSCDEKTDAVSYAGHMGFFQSISEDLAIGNAPGEAPGNENYIPIKKIDLQQIHQDRIDAGIWEEMGDSIEIEAGKLANILCRTNKEMQQLMTFLIREILRNIPEHADISEAWICGQYWNNKTAEIAILDNGIGIKSSLQKNYIHRRYIQDDKSALECAIKAGISQAFNPAMGNRNDDVWSNSGYGLFMVSEICKKLKGSFCIASGDSFININSHGESTIGKTYVNGTAIKMCFSTEELFNSQAIINEIASQGEAQAKTIKNAFKKASVPSKGLVTGSDN